MTSSGRPAAACATALLATLGVVTGCTSSPPPAPVVAVPARGSSTGNGDIPGGGGSSDMSGFGGSPVGLASTSGSVWAAVTSQDELAKMDAVSGDIVDFYPVPGSPLRLVATPHGIWVSEFKAGTVALVDPATGTVSTRVVVGAQPEGLASDGKQLWVVLQKDDELVQLDAATGTRTRTVRLPAGGQPRLAAYAPSAPGRAATVWVLDYGADRVVPVDAGTGTVGAPVAACKAPQALAVDRTRLWVACQGGSLVAVDLATHRVGGTVDLSGLDGSPDAVTVAGGTVWVALATGPTVLTVDPVALKVTGLRKLADDAALTDADVDVLVTGGQVWVSSWNGGGVHHVPVGSLGPPP